MECPTGAVTRLKVLSACASAARDMPTKPSQAAQVALTAVLTAVILADSSGSTTLHQAAADGTVSAVRLLIENGAPLDAAMDGVKMVEIDGVVVL